MTVAAGPGLFGAAPRRARRAESRARRLTQAPDWSVSASEQDRSFGCLVAPVVGTCGAVRDDLVLKTCPLAWNRWGVCEVYQRPETVSAGHVHAGRAACTRAANVAEFAAGIGHNRGFRSVTPAQR